MFLWSNRKRFKWFSPFGLPHWVHLFSPCWSLLLANVLGNFAQQQFLSPTSQCGIVLCNFAWNSDFFFFFFLSSLHGVGEMYLIVGVSTLGSERHLPSPCLILHFSVFFTTLNSGKIQELIGSSFMKIV